MKTTLSRLSEIIRAGRREFMKTTLSRLSEIIRAGGREFLKTINRRTTRLSSKDATDSEYTSIFGPQRLFTHTDSEYTSNFGPHINRVLESVFGYILTEARAPTHF